jgi:hypothetical protein
LPLDTIAGRGTPAAVSVPCARVVPAGSFAAAPGAENGGVMLPDQTGRQEVLAVEIGVDRSVDEFGKLRRGVGCLKRHGRFTEAESVWACLVLARTRLGLFESWPESDSDTQGLVELLVGNNLKAVSSEGSY